MRRLTSSFINFWMKNCWGFMALIKLKKNNKLGGINIGGLISSSRGRWRPGRERGRVRRGTSREMWPIGTSSSALPVGAGVAASQGPAEWCGFDPVSPASLDATLPNTWARDSNCIFLNSNLNCNQWASENEREKSKLPRWSRFGRVQTATFVSFIHSTFIRTAVHHVITFRRRA